MPAHPEICSHLCSVLDEVDGKAPPLAWLNEVLKPLEPPAAVSAGRNFPAPLLIAPRKPGSIRRGPPRGKNKPRGGKESLESNNILKQIVKKLHKGHEMEGEAVLKAEFPGGTSGSLAASAAGREAMPGTVTGDWDRKLDYLEALLENGLKILEDVGAEPVAEGGAASQPIPSTDPLGDAEVTGVSAERTFPGPLVEVAHKPSSHHKGPQTEKIKDTANKISLEPSELMWQMLREMLQGGQEMEGEAVQKEAFPRGSSDSVPASAAGREAMPGTVTGDEADGKASPLAWLNEVLKPLEPPAAVSAGRNFPAPLLIAPRKPGSLRRGPPRGKNKPRGEKELLESNNILKQIVEKLHKEHDEADGKASPLAWLNEVLKPLEPPAGRNFPAPLLIAPRKPGSLRRGPPRGKNKPRGEKELLESNNILKQIVEKLHKEHDEADGKASPLAWLNEVLKPLEPPAAVSAGRNFPAPLLIAPRKPGSLRRGPPRGKNKPRGEKELLESNNILKQIVEKLHKEHEMEGEAVQKEAFPRGSSDSVPASAAGREAMPGTVTGDEVDGKAPPLAWLNEVLKPLEPPAAVSAGRNFPAPLLIAPRKPGSLRRGPPRGKNKPRGEKESLESNNILKQIVKKLHKGHEMEGEAVQKEAFPRGSSDSVPASAAGREAMPGTVTGDEVDGKAPPLAWLNEVLKPLEPPAAVSAGRNFPAPLLIAPRKPGSLRRGPPRGKNKPRGEKESLESNNILKQIVKKLHKGHEMEGEAVLKAEFPGGTSGSLAASAAGREAMPGTVTGDWDHKLDYLEALLENGLKILEDVGAEPVAEGGAASQPIPSTDPLGDAEVTGVSAGRTSPAPGLDAAHQQTSRRRGPPKEKTQDTAATKSHESNEFLRQTQKEAQGGQVTDQTSLQKEAHPGGSSGSVAAPAAGRKAMPGTGTGTGGNCCAGLSRAQPSAGLCGSSSSPRPCPCTARQQPKLEAPRLPGLWSSFTAPGNRDSRTNAPPAAAAPGAGPECPEAQGTGAAPRGSPAASPGPEPALAPDWAGAALAPDRA
ncbi:uncharacterized protein LOC128794028 isoform X4 [Vidua chalybeata]|uniref:uncharacterized protein LOC128794028 isoform X4 n=1 Tax=Vidua chalybeata TaxID=81927 RepID=UPI0023A7B5CB|nr:uncharacterized protein LOC128794028 isoform X4 [Vidua chalybeata]